VPELEPDQRSSLPKVASLPPATHNCWAFFVVIVVVFVWFFCLVLWLCGQLTEGEKVGG
jgi:hypothetical protein